MNDALYRFLINRGFTGSLDDATRQYLAGQIALFGSPVAGPNLDMVTDGANWIPTRCTYTADPGGALFTSTSTSAYIRRLGLTPWSGEFYFKVRVTLTIMVPSTWRGDVLYSNAAHTFMFGSFYKRVDSAPTVGVKTTVEWDMSTLTAGDGDYLNGNPDGLLIQLGVGNGDQFLIERVDVSVFAVAPTDPNYTTNDLWRLMATTGGFSSANGTLQEIQVEWAKLQGAAGGTCWNDVMNNLPA